MFELIGLGIAGAVGVFGHLKARKFVGQRLRYTKIVEKPMLGVWTGVGAAVVTAPLTLLPLIGVGTVIAFGAGVGTGVALGVKDTESPPLLED